MLYACSPKIQEVDKGVREFEISPVQTLTSPLLNKKVFYQPGGDDTHPWEAEACGSLEFEASVVYRESQGSWGHTEKPSSPKIGLLDCLTSKYSIQIITVWYWSSKPVEQSRGSRSNPMFYGQDVYAVKYINMQ